MKRSLATILRDMPYIRLLACDVDGVLTDGGMYFGPQGQAFKRFHVKDGLGLTLLRESGVQIAFISADSSEIVRARAAALGVQHLCVGVENKAAALRAIMEKEGLGREEVVYIGDDLPDLCVAPYVGLFVAPADAAPEIKARAGYITEQPGGYGAVREICDAIRAHNAAWERRREKPGEANADG